MRWHTLFPAEQRSPSLLSFVSLCLRRPAISSVLSAITFYGTALLCSLLNFPSLFLAYGFRMPLWTSTSYYFLALLSAGFWCFFSWPGGCAGGGCRKKKEGWGWGL